LVRGGKDRWDLSSAGSSGELGFLYWTFLDM
jgi:hypothetical protein